MTGSTVETLASRHREVAARLLPKVELVIGGERRAIGGGGVYEHVNPSTGLVQAEVPMASGKDVDEAVAAARRALPGWRNTKPTQRRDILAKFADLIRDYEHWAPISVIENGMPMVWASTFAGYAYDWTSYYASWADKLTGEVSIADSDELVYTMSEPYGVIASIITWNAPLLSLVMKLPAALAAGNTIVLKPAEFTPFTPMIFVELARAAGIPDGVINVVPGGNEAGEALVRH
ncbi:MAG: aldehyde dehydrogenase family protein, partial [Mycobacterium sp.]